MSEMVIAGRTFVSLQNSTFEHDIWMTRKIRESGLANAFISEGEASDEFAERLTTEVISSGVALELLGGLFVPQGTDPEDWTPELGKETAAFFGRVTDAPSKALLRGQIASMLVYFFVNGLASLRISPKSGNPTATGEPHVTEDVSTTGTSG